MRPAPPFAAFEAWLRSIVRDEIATASVDLAGTYDSKTLPPGVGAKRFHEILRSGVVAGAVKEGRVWRCSRESWHAARSQRRSGPVLRVIDGDAVGASNDRARAREALREAGFRPTRGAR
jgi:hypothetical protein